jgi:hypothetical protein
MALRLPVRKKPDTGCMLNVNSGMDEITIGMISWRLKADVRSVGYRMMMVARDR